MTSTTSGEHNAARARFGAPPLTWSEDLAHTAQSCANQCNFAHDETRGDANDIGENLGQSGDGNEVPVQYVVGRWKQESSSFQYGYEYPESDNNCENMFSWEGWMGWDGGRHK
ncbi:hypothetical protein BGZ59_004932 [Podila verticillata]|nr:hypothetical protein BGZ59_004932 [Podila verticillata]